MNTSVLAQFERHYQPVTESGCWIWMGATQPFGHGQLRIQGKLKIAHRVSYELFRGPIPDGKQICHQCDVPCCVNPAHLFVGTQKDNMQDMREKGRGKKSRLSPGAIESIKQSSERTGLLAERYSVSPASIVRIRGRRPEGDRFLLTAAQVGEIRTSKERTSVLAAKYEVSQPTICVIRGRIRNIGK